MTVSVITPSLPSRTPLLAEAIQSVAHQSSLPVEHLVGIDHQRAGPAIVRNRLADAAQGEWLAFLDDDDLLHPHHLDTLLAHADESATVIYSRPDGYDPSGPFDPDALQAGHNMIPVTTLVRRSRFLEAGGFNPDAAHGWEDHGLWLGLLDHGARFRFVDEITWTYRLHEGSRTLAGESSAR